LYFLLYDVYGCFVGANIVRPCLFVAAAAFPVRYGIRPYILSFTITLQIAVKTIYTLPLFPMPTRTHALHRLKKSTEI
jgi:hypothetical protein